MSSASVVGVIGLPSSRGFSPNLLPLGFGLTAFRCCFPFRPHSSRPALLPPFRVVIVSDSMLRPLQTLKWPAPFAVNVFSFSGVTFREVLLQLLEHHALPYDVFVVRAGVNDASRVGDDFSLLFRSTCVCATEVMVFLFSLGFSLVALCGLA